MRADFLAMLRCPFCRGGFRFEEVARPPLGRGAFGVLECTCSAFPMIDGVPVIQRAPVAVFEHTRGERETEGVAVETLVAMLRAGKAAEALNECLVAPAVPRPVRALIRRRLLDSALVARAARPLGKRALETRVLKPRDTIGACDVFDFYYFSGPLDSGLGHYFINRFAQPRHLAALALAATLKSDAKPFLDIACGAGHLEHYFTTRPDPAGVVGLDINFHQVWIAKHWIAPAGEYVCADASAGLPFADDSFGATICSDAYHYIGERQTLLREIERCAPARPVLLTRVGNRAVMPHEGDERALDDYLGEFAGREARVFEEGELVRAYLKRDDPFDTPQRPKTALAEAKWFSFAWSMPQTRRAVAEPPAPHAVGKLDINPIYAQAVQAGGKTKLNFVFPQTWYAYENHAMLSYCPQEATVPAGDPRSWRKEEQRTLTDAFVLLGLPERFAESR